MKINLNKTFIAIGICALTVAARADDMVNTNMSTMPLTAQSFVWEAALTDLKEIHMGEMALQKSANADVKSFAKRIVADHKKADKKLQAIAAKEGLNFPDTNSLTWDAYGRWQTNSWSTNSGNFQSPPIENQDKDSPPHLANLLVTNAEVGAVETQINWEALSGADFDRAFANHMVMGHEKAIRTFEDASANLTDANLKKYADKTLPTLREHLQLAQDLQSKLGTDSGMTNSTPQN